ncbi:hypothetical protein V6R21_32245 [Limibacter armeniacum]|uniref:hypothetical protein n=1 Tax=Limibacter armeniacum TaxID=466084 RepID=UPI002FE5516A
MAKALSNVKLVALLLDELFDKYRLEFRNLNIGDTGELARSINRHILANPQMVKSIKISYLRRGMYVDQGTGRGLKFSEGAAANWKRKRFGKKKINTGKSYYKRRRMMQAANKQTQLRKPKPWFTTHTAWFYRRLMERTLENSSDRAIEELLEAIPRMIEL